METIVIYGAQGKFGSRLYQRLQNILDPEHYKIIPTTDKKVTVKLAEQADILLLAVQPEKVENLLQEIAPYLKGNAKIISCAAQIPLETIEHITHRESSRLMADPWWNVSGVLSKSDIPSCLNNLTAQKPLQIKDDKGIDEFTIHLSYLFVAFLLKKIHPEINYSTHVKHLTDYFGITDETAESYIPKEYDSERLLEIIATKGGISECLLRKLKENSEILPKSLIEEVLSEKFSHHVENKELKKLK